MQNTKNFLIALTVIAFTLSIAFAVFLFKKETKKSHLPILGQVRNFTLTDENGYAFSLNQLRGKVWVVDFIFTTCSDICPVMSQNMAKLNRTFEGVKNIKLVSVTVNPENDTSEVLKKYSEQFKGEKSKWHFITGSREEITELVVGSFKLGAIDEPIFHSSYFTLVDQFGLIRGYYDGLKQEEVNKLFKDASQLLKK